MKVILLENVEKLGDKGDLVQVKNGYGRNYLIPQGKAVFATPGKIREYQELERQAEMAKELSVEKAHELAEKVSAASITIPVKAGEDGKIFGTVTTSQIAEALAEKELVVDKKKITINGDVKALGEYTATVAIQGEIKANLTFWVVNNQ